jgi:riboflavin kinase/FMN adenylyltransferase
MELVRGAHNLKARHRDCVASVGNFDGVHLGHQKVLAKLASAAKALGVPTTVIVFEPQPAEYFAVGDPPPRLTRFREKFKLLDSFGIDQMIMINFSDELAALSADEFVEDIFVKRLAVRKLIVGDDFRMGRNRGGDYQRLCELGERHGFSVERTESHIIEGTRVGSTAIRGLIRDGDFAAAARMLGRPYTISGRVVRGHQRGRAYGFPTANLNMDRTRPPLNGIYATEVRGLSDRPIPSVSYVGSRPVVDDPTYVLEVHLFDYDQDCYGRHIEVEFHHKVRDDMDFDSFDDLRDQIERDCASARQILAATA